MELVKKRRFFNGALDIYLLIEKLIMMLPSNVYLQAWHRGPDNIYLQLFYRCLRMLKNNFATARFLDDDTYEAFLLP
jgi:hypothetical protein